MLEFNVGEIATRLRSALGVRGRMPLSLDEHVIPAALVQNVQISPFRRNPIRVGIAHQAFTLTVGQQAMTEVHLGALASTPDVFYVIDQVMLIPEDRTIATGLNVADTVTWAVFEPTRLSAVVTRRLGFTERYPVSSVIAEYTSALAMADQTTASNPPTLGVPLFISSGARSGAPIWYGDITLQGPNALALVSGVSATAGIESRFRYAVSGLLYGLGG